MKRPGRNDLCPCGSGKKYKHCHYGRSDRPRTPISSIINSLDEAKNTKLCVHPTASQATCSNKIINAHTIQRSGQLERIATNGMVYCIDDRLMTLKKSGGQLVERLTHVKQASTFTGFCSHHDLETFKPIELSPIVLDDEQCFLIGYRALCREWHAKKSALDNFSVFTQHDLGWPLDRQVAFQKDLQKMRRGYELGVEDIRFVKDVYDAALVAHDFSQIANYVIEFDRIPEIMCSGGMTPGSDLDGKPIQSLSDIGRRADTLTFSLVATTSGGAAVFTWVRQDETAAEKFIRSLDSTERLQKPHAVVRLAFCQENIAMAPAWWDGLTDSERQCLRDRRHAAVSPFIPAMSFRDDGLRCVQWNVLSTKSTEIQSNTSLA
jgi:hypothetical protein